MSSIQLPLPVAVWVSKLASVRSITEDAWTLRLIRHASAAQRMARMPQELSSSAPASGQ